MPIEGLLRRPIDNVLSLFLAILYILHVYVTVKIDFLQVDTL